MKPRQIFVLAGLAILVALATLMGGAGSARADYVDFQIPPQFDSQLMRDAVAAINEVQATHPEIPDFEVRIQPIRVSAYAGTTNFGNIVINTEYAANPQMWAESFAIDQAANFHSSACESAGTYVGYHEAAHVLMLARGDDADDQAAALYGDGSGFPKVSGYAQESGDWNEALAEAYSSVKCGAPTAFELDLYNIVENS